MRTSSPWIGKPWLESVFILSPPFICLLIIFLFPSVFAENQSVSDWYWVILVLLIDVAHVYSTLYRTYFDPETFQNQKTRLIAIPVVGFVVAVLVYSVQSGLFWRLLAYLAVYHFVRQQYGFMRLYARKETTARWQTKLDACCVYAATLYPILYWHLTGPRAFNWFVENDFWYFHSPVLLAISRVVYVAVLVLYALKEAWFSWKNQRFNLPKNLIVAGTILSWYIGIVYFNGDLPFTLLNIVSHGIPYMALIWLYGAKNYQEANRGSRFLQWVFRKKTVLIFLGILFLLAFVEEGLWDWIVWQEHRSVFGSGRFQIPSLNQSWLSLIIPLLTVPQLTHYILDGFIWRIRKGDLKSIH